MVNYLRRFSPVLTELSEPLRRLQKWDTVFAWESEQQTAFDKYQDYTDYTSSLDIFQQRQGSHHTDWCTSKTRLGAVLLQEGQPVVYASRVLTDTECRYSNIKRELLGVVFGLERLHHYTFGKSITVETEHQPLTSIWKKTIATSSPRQQRLLLRLAKYDVHIEYLWGRENVIADALSRVAPLKPEATRLQHQSKEHRKNPSPPDHTDCTSKSRETTRNMWGHIKGSNTKATGKD